jgi:glycosyltransferase involved in cell wall biosynthesis
MPDSPHFSVILATYNRGRHIVPTIESVLRQTFSAFELLVVGDGCTDATEQTVASLGSDRIVWRNAPFNSGSQSFPNNAGLREARGAWIAYIGHDDIWANDHLARLHDLVEQEPATDFAVSGCIFHGPPGSEAYFVTGLFADSAMASEHFFPPSSIAHRADVVERIGGWREPQLTTAPVDCDFLLRAVHGGLRFASTGHVTVHKFAAGHRYLSYLRPSADEQHAMLRALDRNGDAPVAGLIERSKRGGMFMNMRYPDFSQYEKGQLFEIGRLSKGLKRPQLRWLSERTVFEQSAEQRALDWHPREDDVRPFRWSGPNPRPKILLPLIGDRANVRIQMAPITPRAVCETLSVQVEEELVDHRIESETDGNSSLTFIARLRTSDYTIVTLNVPDTKAANELGLGDDVRRLGVAVSDIVVEPVP